MDGDRLVVGVRDTGPGIAEQAHASVFERFRQTTHFSPASTAEPGWVWHWCVSLCA